MNMTTTWTDRPDLRYIVLEAEKLKGRYRIVDTHTRRSIPALGGALTYDHDAAVARAAALNLSLQHQQTD